MLPWVALVPALGEPVTGERDQRHHSGSWVRRVTEQTGGTTWTRTQRKEEGDQQELPSGGGSHGCGGSQVSPEGTKPPADSGRDHERFKTRRSVSLHLPSLVRRARGLEHNTVPWEGPVDREMGIWGVPGGEGSILQGEGAPGAWLGRHTLQPGLGRFGLA